MAGNEEETGILLGTGSAGASPLVELERQMAVESPEAASPFLFPCTVANAPASIAAIELKIKGPNVTITQKDPAGLNALFYGRLLIADERAKAIVVGAVDEWNLTTTSPTSGLGVLRTPTKPGFVLAEGCSVVLARGRAPRPAPAAPAPGHASPGAASAGSPVSPQQRRARPEEIAATIRAALADAGLPPSRVGLVHALGRTASRGSTRPRRPPSPRSSARRRASSESSSQVGENPCSGALQLALAARRALRDEPSLGAVLVNSLGAGGNQIAVVLTAP